jgi:hypothetical protein
MRSGSAPSRAPGADGTAPSDAIIWCDTLGRGNLRLIEGRRFNWLLLPVSVTYAAITEQHQDYCLTA